MFDNLRGIEGREAVVEAGERAELEKLLSCAKDICQTMSLTSGHYEKIHETRYPAAKAQLEHVRFDESDLSSFIHAYSNQEDQRAQGIFAGILLQILTERNAAQGKRTRFHINGRGAKFDFLFSDTRKFDDLVVEDFQGHDICSFITCGGGAGNSLVLLNNKDTSKFSQMCMYVGMPTFKSVGAISTAIAVGNKAAELFRDSLGSAGLAMLINNETYSLGHGLGAKSERCPYQGIGYLIIKGNDIGCDYYDMLKKGRAELVYVSYHRETDSLRGFADDGGEVGTFVLEAMYPPPKEDTFMLDYGFFYTGGAKIRRIIHIDPTGNENARSGSGKIGECFSGPAALRQYAELDRQKGISRMIALAESLPGQRTEEMFSMLDEINALYAKARGQDV